jgi:hypothetical protein
MTAAVAHPPRISEIARRMPIGTLPSKNDARALRDEAQWLHQALLGRPASPAVEDAYLRCLDALPGDERDDALIACIVARRLDVEAIELALRHRLPALSRRCRALLYLVEAEPAGYRTLTRTAPARATAWLALAVAALRTPYKRAKGRWLVSRHRLEDARS